MSRDFSLGSLTRPRGRVIPAARAVDSQIPTRALNIEIPCGLISVGMSLNRRSVLKLGVVDLGVESARLPNGLTLELAVIRHPGAAAIVAIDERGEVAMLRAMASRDRWLPVGDTRGNAAR